MSITTLQVIAVACDAPDCEAEELFDSSHEEARRKARVLGWAITSRKQGGPVTAWCPAHRRYQRRNRKPSEPA